MILSGGSIETFPRTNCSIPPLPGPGDIALFFKNAFSKKEEVARPCPSSTKVANLWYVEVRDLITSGNNTKATWQLATHNKQNRSLDQFRGRQYTTTVRQKIRTTNCYKTLRWWTDSFDSKVLHRLATSAAKVDGIRRPEVVISRIFSNLSFISSKEWMYHAAVVMKNDNIVLVGGQQRHDNHKRGEIVKSKDGNVVSLSGGLGIFSVFFTISDFALV